MITPSTDAVTSAIEASFDSLAAGMIHLKIVKSNRSDYLKKEDRGGVGEVAFQQVAVQELSAEFEIELPYTILADGKPYVVDVTSYTLPATYMHYAVPKQDADAF